MFENLPELVIRRDELSDRLNDPSLLADPARWQKTVKELNALTPVTDCFAAYEKARRELADCRALLEAERDEEMRALLKEEISAGEESVASLERQLTLLLLPKDPNDERNVIVEIRAGVGGDEAALFAAELYRMYARYAERVGWKLETVDENENDLGGLKEIVFMIRGRGAYSRMKYESGAHRVQRVPETESGGRIHTSAATVAVLAEASEVDVAIDPSELRVDVFRSSGAGGQKVNKTSSAIRITHLPTGIVVQCQNERSQYQNKDMAMEMLRAKLYQRELEKQQSALTADRRSQVGSGDRSEKIRTYNFPQSRVTDHRIGFTTHRLPEVMDGALDELFDALVTYDQAQKLAASGEPSK